jgi:hypothetical protein
MTDEELAQAHIIMDILKYDIITDSHGTKYYYQHGKRHRNNGPAVEYADGTLFYYQNDKCHREDGPAAIFQNGEKQWWVDGHFIKVEGDD